MRNDPMSAVAVVSDIVDNFKYGDILTKEWLYDRFAYDPQGDSNRETQRYARAMASVHDALRVDHKRVLQEVEGGYRIALPSEHARIAVRRTESAFAAGCAEGDSVLAATPLDLLDGEQKAAHTDAQNRIASLRAMARLKK